jgi:hypothetical protein
LATHRLDDLAHPVDVDAIFPALTRIAYQRSRKRSVLKGRVGGRPRGLLVLRDRGAKNVLTETSGVGQQVPERHRTPGRAQLQCAGRIEPCEHLHPRQFRHDVSRRGVELQQGAAFNELHRGSGRDGFGHRGDPEDRIGRHGCVFPEFARAESAFVQDALIRGCHRHDAGHILRVHRLAEHVINGLCAAHLVTPLQNASGTAYEDGEAAPLTVPHSQQSAILCWA